jgi:hypothetical protein
VEGNSNGQTRTEELLLQLIDVVKEQGLELVKIREELVQTRHELGGRIDQTREELVQTRHELGDRIDQTNVRIDQLRVELLTDTAAIRTATQAGLELLSRADARHEREDSDLRSRIDRIEQHIGLRSL